MSFAATLAIVAGYQGSLAWTHGGADTPLGARIALFGGREVVSLVLVSLLAGFATTLYVAYHFHRLTPYGVIANLLAMPIVSVWVMPAGIAGVLTLPLGFDGFFWRLMGLGIEWMVGVALWVTSLPGSVGRIAAFETGPLLLGSAGLILLGLLKSPLRLAGAALLGLTALWAVQTAQPDVLVSPDGASFAVRTAPGRLAVLRTGSDTFAVGQWLAADADARTAKDPLLGQGIDCDDAGCVGRLADGTVVAIARTIEAFAEDCARAALVLSARLAPPGCQARSSTARNGSGAGRSRCAGPARAGRSRRPGRPATTGLGRRPELSSRRAKHWSRTPDLRRRGALRTSVRRGTQTPRSEDLEPGD